MSVSALLDLRMGIWLGQQEDVAQAVAALAASSLGMLLTARGLRVVMQKLGLYLNATPGAAKQVIPHITNEIKHRIRRMATDEMDVAITEISGTVGDIESIPFLETERRVRHEVGRDNVFVVRISLLPCIGPSGKLKTRPTQHSARRPARRPWRPRCTASGWPERACYDAGVRGDDGRSQHDRRPGRHRRPYR